MEEKIALIRKMFKKGKFKMQTSQDLLRFESIEGPTLPYQDKTFELFYDNKNASIVYGHIEEKHGRSYLTFLKFFDYEYTFNENSNYEWFDVHMVGFKDLKRKK